MIKHKKGDVVWAQADKQPYMASYSKWCMIQIIAQLENDLSQVVFFNDHSRAVLLNNKIYEFLKFESKFSNTSKRKAFKEAIIMAREKAKERKRRQESASPTQKNSNYSKKKQVSPVVVISKKSTGPKRKTEGSVSPKGRGSSRLRKGDESPTLTPPKRKRRAQQSPEAMKKKFKQLSQQGKYGRKKLKKNPPSKPQPSQEKEQSEDQKPDKKVSPAELERIKEKVSVRSVEELPPDLSALRELRRRVDNLTVKIYTMNDIENTRLSQESIKDLEDICGVLRGNSLKVEDMLVTRISNMVYFIVKTLAKKQECMAIIDRIKKQLNKMKDSLTEKFENTAKYEKDLRDIRLERAQTTINEASN